MSATPRERLRENATEIASTIVTGFWLVALFTGQSWWLAALLLGYVVVVPLVALLFGDEDDKEEWWDDWMDDDWMDKNWWTGWWGDTSKRGSSGGANRSPAESGARGDVTETNNREALETLRNRYARGELTDEQFERKVERLLDTETLEDVEDRRERERGDDRLRER